MKFDYFILGFLSAFITGCLTVLCYNIVEKVRFRKNEINRGDVLIDKNGNPFIDIEWKYQTVVSVEKNDINEIYYVYYYSNIDGEPNMDDASLHTSKYYKDWYKIANHIEDEHIKKEL